MLSHTAGLSGWDEPLTMFDLLDHDKLVALHAAQAPWWEPGTQSGYHAISQGYLLGEIVKRVDGRTLGTFFAEEVAGPLGADFHIGTPPECDPRVARVIPPSAPLSAADVDPTSIAMRTFTNPAIGAEFSWRKDWRRAEIPAAGGHGNARSVALCHTPTACGGTANGVTLLSQEGVERIFDVQYEGPDLNLPLPLKLGMGFGLPGEMLPVPNPRTCFWGGWGGSLAIIDVDAQMSFSYVMNKMGEGTTGDMRGAGLLLAAYAAMHGLTLAHPIPEICSGPHQMHISAHISVLRARPDRPAHGIERMVTVPMSPLSSIVAPSGMRLVASVTDTTHGIPSSRLTMMA